MTSFQMRLRLALLAVALAAAGQEFRLLSRQQNGRQALIAQRDRLQGQLRRLQRENVAAADDLAQANQDLAQLLTENQSANSDREIQIRSWLKKTQYFHDLFAQRPGQAIPELQLLTPLEWLRLSHEAKTGSESEIRQGLAAIRAASTMKFIGQLVTALQKYTEDHDGILPPSPIELAPYLDPTMNPAVLDRYEMLASGKVSDLSPMRGRYAISQSAPIDAEYDERNYASVPNYGTSSGLWRTDELAMSQREALEAYTRDTGVQMPKSNNEWISYVSSPAMREILLALDQYRLSHPSKGWPEHASQVLPFLTSPEAKAKAAKFWPEASVP